MNKVLFFYYYYYYYYYYYLLLHCFFGSRGKKKLCTYQCNATGGGGARPWGGDLTFSKICNQIPCPRANQSSQNNNLGHKGGPSKNSFVKRGVIIYYRSSWQKLPVEFHQSPLPKLKINGPLPPPPPLSHSSSTSPVLECWQKVS